MAEPNGRAILSGRTLVPIGFFALLVAALLGGQAYISSAIEAHNKTVHPGAWTRAEEKLACEARKQRDEEMMRRLERIESAIDELRKDIRARR